MIVYPNTKWRMVHDIFCFLSSSNNPKFQKLLFSVLEEYVHPLKWNGDKTISLEKQDNFSAKLQYDGLCFEKGRLVKVTEELSEKIESRIEKRKKEVHKLGGFESFFELATKKTEPKKETPKPDPINVVIHNQNIQNNQSSHPAKQHKLSSSSKEYFFNLEKSTLNIGGKEIKIGKTTKQYEVLREIFKDTSKDWQFSEIAENLDKFDADKWEKLYDTVNAIGKKIATETQIKDFFITTTQSVKISEAFTEKSL